MSYDLCSSRQCNVCLLFPNKNSPSKTLSKCNGCRLVSYCGREHQKQDWSIHSPFCRAIQKILKVCDVEHPLKLEKEPKTVQDLERSIALLKHTLRITLCRPLNFYEEELTSFPVYCGLCFNLKNLRSICNLCKAVSYCNDEHKKDHEAEHRRHCDLLQVYYCQYKVERIEDRKDVPFNGFLVKVAKLQNSDLIDAIQFSAKISIPKNPTINLENYQLFAFIADFSCIATICYALEHVNMNTYQNMELRIFLVGATVEENLWFQTVHTRFLFLQYPKIECLSFYYIGPEAEQESGSHSQMYLFLGKKRVVNHITYKGLFQDFIHSSVILPSLVVAFNCGFSEHPALPKIVTDRIIPDVNMSSNKSCMTWSEGIREILLTHDVPFLFTSFTSSEADADFAELLHAAEKDINHLSIGVTRIIKSSQNPYRDFRPLRNWQLTDGEEIYYRNGYIQLVRSCVNK